MRRVAVEQYLRFVRLGIDPVDPRRIPCRRQQGAVGLGEKCPNVGGVRVEDRRGAAVRSHTIDLALWRSGGEYGSGRRRGKGEDVCRAGVEDDLSGTIRLDAIKSAVIAATGPQRAVGGRSQGPHHGRRRGEELVGARTEAEMAVGVDRQGVDLTTQEFGLGRHPPEDRSGCHGQQDAQGRQEGDAETARPAGRAPRRGPLQRITGTGH